MDSANFPLGSEGWKKLYQSAVLEPDYTILFERIAEARSAILRHVETLPLNPTSEERRALRNALRTLELLEGAAHRRKEEAA